MPPVGKNQDGKGSSNHGTGDEQQELGEISEVKSWKRGKKVTFQIFEVSICR